MPVTRDNFVKDYVKAIQQGAAALFIGAGMSKPAGFVDWPTLLADIAKDLGLDAARETDLVALAQFHVNANGGSRGKLNQLLVEEFTKGAQLTDNHRLLGQMPIGTIWTTNYDRLIEQAFADAFRILDVKHRQAQLATTRPRRDAVLYKMHGDCESPDEAVLTKEDYELYNQERPLFTETLKGDLVSKTFLFLGFSFEDPNLDYILSRIRVLMERNQRPHFCIMRKVQPNDVDCVYRAKRQVHRVQDLKRYSIRTLLIDDYAEITTILRQIHKRVHLNDFFVSGSAHEYGALGQSRMQALCRALGSQIVNREMSLTSGFGLGIGGTVLLGAMEASRDTHLPLDARIRTHPFPQGLTDDQKRDLWPQIRRQMIESCGVAVFIAGNKLDKDGKVIESSGVFEEFALAKELGKYPIPLGCTGYAAKTIWDEVTSNLGGFFPGIDVATEFAAIGNPQSDITAVLNAVFGIVKKVYASQIM